ncbi:tetratricopeptide repeat protein [Robbsia sp. Bb-Pol-6]|uniref:Tetratricopeptide repeat protein n=1 Tax=Robbsia betulipollinis TaxID=2981849 RepID=A0ABT3ZSR9_9BURK|nr:tetratricopeptide repeat protein [Robbsia betulipollinis]MCY0389482.1 tetratricopeptide repeat protein [Robbsia betulipollinis]
MTLDDASRPSRIVTSTRPARHASCAVLGAVVLAAAAGCTTTTHVTPTQSSTLNHSPSTMSELRIAEVALDAGNIEMARTIFERVVKANPDSVPGLTGLGNTLYSVGDFTRAGVYFEQASRVDPDASLPLLGIARVAIRQRRFDDAIAASRKILSKTPDDPLAVSALGVSLDMKGEHATAQAVLRRGLATHPGDPLLSVNLGLSLVLGGDPRQGANVLLDVTRYPNAPAQARQNLALAYGLMGNGQAAAEILGQDLPQASVQDNLRFYEIQRKRMAQQQVSSVDTVQAGAVR